ncbi:uncharacterized protein EI90DRAFT_3291479 [Cantharellus anzutake]|uniref:uncharacterized protein n=1 Tax=Cantharellus anzutake TaxID=1750568 RepID=UPI00190417DE|nr:uncharacterized protein EI90DRAFT_3291479 [Cantharellus anzutake]KAF8325993.1 hypothetical protein EI90DRAFT_3291479 [Cantharellus anzutake]
MSLRFHGVRVIRLQLHHEQIAQRWGVWRYEVVAIVRSCGGAWAPTTFSVASQAPYPFSNTQNTNQEPGNAEPPYILDNGNNFTENNFISPSSPSLSSTIDHLSDLSMMQLQTDYANAVKAQGHEAGPSA